MFRPAPSGPLIRIESIGRRFGSVPALDSVSLDIADGEFFCLLGPSGSGKSTLLRLLGGFDAPDEGRILIAGRDMRGVPPETRPVNTVFQSYALFPHLTVAGNVAYGLRRAGFARGPLAARVAEMLRLVRLEGFGARYPAQLSGGQAQRVALARALARDPRVLLLDEPLAALDRRLREETAAELKQLQARVGTTFVMVTHDQGEALGLADRIAVMGGGRVLQVGTPQEVYRRPATRFVARFLGGVNLLSGTVEALGPGGATVRLAGGGATVEAALPSSLGPDPGGAVEVAIRPEALRLVEPGVPGALAGIVTGLTFEGASSRVALRLADGTAWQALRPDDGGFAPPALGQAVGVAVAPGGATVLEPEP